MSTDGKKKRIVQTMVLLAILGVLGIMAVVSSMKSVGGDLADYRSIKADFEKGRYSYSAPGVITLSSSDRAATFDGFIYVTGDPPELILFPRWRSSGASLVATGWSSKPLTVGSEVDARIPHQLENAETEQTTLVPPTSVEKTRVVRDLNDGWYVFERRDR